MSCQSVEGGELTEVRAAEDTAGNADVRILLLSGSTRAASTNTAVLRTASVLAPDGVVAVLYEGLDGLPAFNPDQDRDPLPPGAAELRAQIGGADALLLCTPEYAGGLPGSFKNLLDWTVGGTEMNDKAVGWLNVSSVAAPTGGAGAYESLAATLGWVNAAVVDAACLRAPMTRAAVGPDGHVSDPDVRAQLAAALGALARYVQSERRRQTP